jgi:PAS domain S-box-containing protein
VGITLLFPQIQAVLPPIGFVALSSVFFVRAILNEQLFQPLRRLNAQLQASEERYRLLSELTSDYAYKVVFTEDGRFHFEWLTEAFTRITGYTAAELEAERNWASFVHPDDANVIQAMDAQMLAGEVAEGEYRIITKNYETIWVREHRRPILDENGRLQSLTGAAKDITKRKTTELALQDSEAKHRLLLDSIRLPVLALEPDMTIYYCNTAYARFVGISAPELEGKNLLELFPGFQNRKSYEVYQQVLKTGVPGQVEGQFGERVLLAQVFPAPWGLLSVADDVTDRKIAEEALAMSRMKTELLAKVGHELRTPLGAILGYAEMLHHGTRGPVTDEQKKMLQRIMVNTEKLIDNVNAMLDEAQIELGTLKLNMADFSPQALLENMHAVLDLKAKAKKIRFTSEVDGNMPPFVTADFQRLHQVLVNLADNAIKFTETGWVHVRIFRQDEAHWQIAVSDTGIGISETAQMYIFDAFRQVDGSPTRQKDGVGLGLSIVKQLVTLMDGTIDVKSAPGEGATFTVVLPLVTIQESAV